MEMNSALRIFDQQKIDSSIDSESYTPIQTLTKVDESGPYVFRVEPNPDFIDLENMMLRVQCKITRGDGSNIELNEKISTVCNINHSLFNKVDVLLGDTVVSHTNSLYPERSYLEDVLFTDNEEAEGRLQMQGFVLDESGRFHLNDPQEAGPNAGLVARANAMRMSNEVAFMGKLHIDISRQSKYLLDNVPITITLHRSPDGYSLIGAAAAAVAADSANGVAAKDAVPLDHKIKITNMTLLVPTVKVSEAMRRGIEATLKKTPARYPVTRTTMNTHLIPHQTTSYTIPSMFRGLLPHFVLFCMVSNEERRPDRTKNPFRYEEYELNKMTLYRNNEPINYSQGLKMDYTQGTLYTEAYFNCLKNLGRLNKGMKFDMLGFRGGFAFYPFKIMPQKDLSTNASLLNTGSLDLQLEFSNPTPKNLDLIVLAQYNGEFTIDEHRAVRMCNA